MIGDMLCKLGLATGLIGLAALFIGLAINIF